MQSSGRALDDALDKVPELATKARHGDVLGQPGKTPAGWTATVDG